MQGSDASLESGDERPCQSVSLTPVVGRTARTSRPPPGPRSCIARNRRFPTEESSWSIGAPVRCGRGRGRRGAARPRPRCAAWCPHRLPGSRTWRPGQRQHLVPVDVRRRKTIAADSVARGNVSLHLSLRMHDLWLPAARRESSLLNGQMVPTVASSERWPSSEIRFDVQPLATISIALWGPPGAGLVFGTPTRRTNSCPSPFPARPCAGALDTPARGAPLRVSGRWARQCLPR